MTWSRMENVSTLSVARIEEVEPWNLGLSLTEHGSTSHFVDDANSHKDENCTDGGEEGYFRLRSAASYLTGYQM